MRKILIIILLLSSAVAVAQPGVGIPGNNSPRFSFNQLFRYYGGSFHMVWDKDSVGVGALTFANKSFSTDILPSANASINIGSSSLNFLVVRTQNIASNGTSLVLNNNNATGQLNLQINSGTVGRFYSTGNFVLGSGADNGTDKLQGGTGSAIFNTYKLGGTTSGTISITPQAAAGTYNFNLPTTAGTTGQVLTSQGGGSNAMTWTTPGNPVVEITGTSQAANGNTIYIPHNASLTTITVPTTTTIGTLYQVIGEGTGGWKLQLPSGYTCVGVGSFTTTSGGSLNSTDPNCTITIRLTNTNKFTVTTSQGTINPL